jgi:hypothetical protein
LELDRELLARLFLVEPLVRVLTKGDFLKLEIRLLVALKEYPFPAVYSRRKSSELCR